MRPTQRLALIAEMVPELKENRSTTSVARVLEKSLGGLDRIYVQIVIRTTGEERLYGPWRSWEADGADKHAEQCRRALGNGWAVEVQNHPPRCQCEKCLTDSRHILGLV